MIDTGIADTRALLTLDVPLGVKMGMFFIAILVEGTLFFQGKANNLCNTNEHVHFYLCALTRTHTRSNALTFTLTLTITHIHTHTHSHNTGLKDHITIPTAENFFIAYTFIASVVCVSCGFVPLNRVIR